MFHMDLDKAEKPESKSPTSVLSYRKQGNSRKTSTSGSFTTLNILNVDKNKLQKILRDGTNRPLVRSQVS